MTFDEWMKSERITYVDTDDSILDRILRKCWDAAIEAAADVVEKRGARIGGAVQPGKTAKEIRILSSNAKLTGGPSGPSG